MPPQLSAPIREPVEALVRGLQSILGARLIGLYLAGSLVMDDFCPPSSDLDFLVVTDGLLSPEDSLAVGQLHAELLERYPMASRLEGDYAPLHLLTPQGTSDPVPGCEAGRFLPRVGEIMLSADNMYNVREQGWAMYGPPPREILPETTAADVRAAVREMLANGTGPTQTPAEMADSLLGLLRSACALESGRPATKSQGAAWGLQNLESRWHPAIQTASAIRCGTAPENGHLALQQALPALDQLLRKRYL